MIRVLDPATAVQRPVRARRWEDGDRRRAPAQLRPTVYVAEKLLVRGDQADQGIEPKVAALLAERFGWTLSPVRKPEPRREYRLDVKLESRRPQVLTLSVAEGRLAAPPDAWLALQHIADEFPELAGEFELVHVLAATTLTGVGGYWSGIGGYWSGIGGYWSGIGGYWSGIGGYWSGIGTSSTPGEYGVPGLGGRSPVALVVADPALTAPKVARPPVVVMPDTGIGVHPWFRDLSAQPLAFPPPPASGVEVKGSPVADVDDGVTDYLTGDIQRLAGHGTFIAGIVRQACPSARLEAHAVMASSGVMEEDVLLDDLHDLLERQLGALESGDAAGVVDVLTLSVGYYHEEGADADDASIAQVLRDLGRAGVLVVAGAGNDATTEPMLPAGFAGGPAEASALPLVSVGSLNPNGASVSLFSNAGDWVTTYRTGAAIVSTLPVNMNAGVQSSSRVDGDASLTPAQRRALHAGVGHPPRDRSTIDRDDYSGGFGVWSGTSFATPVLAGELARALLEKGTEAVDLSSMLDRGWAALSSVLGLDRP